MADADYTFRACSVEGCLSKHKSQGLCAKHYMQSKRKGLNHYSRSIKCSHCGVEFEPGNASAMYCSKRCKHAAWVKNNPDRTALLRNRSRIQAKPKYSSVAFNKCNSCSKLFVSKRKMKYCCDACKPKPAYVSQIKPSSICKQCGVEFVQSSSGGRPSDYCGDECKEAKNKSTNKVYRAARRKSIGSSHRKRARKYGCKYQPVVINKVLERDGYRCKLCGVKTPKRKRGTYDDDAPELDHIVPLSKGGEHSYLNTQCACRKCNIEKADKPLGQMLMF